MRCDVHCIQWSPTNGALACGGSDGRAHLLKPSGELLGRIPDAAPDDGYDGRPGDAHTDGRETGSSNASHPPIRALAFSKGSRYLATAGASTEVTIWDLKRKQKLKTLSGHADAIAAVQYSPGDTHVASAGREGVVVLHSPVSGLVVGTMVTPGTCCAFPKSRHRPFAQQVFDTFHFTIRCFAYRSAARNRRGFVVALLPAPPATPRERVV